MPEHPPPHSAPGLSLGDIYYVLFRHKWKILLLVGVGVAAAVLLPLVWQRPYQSEAKLFIKYVLDTKTPSPGGPSDARVKSPDDRGENIINTELEILTSLDIAEEVATNIGPEKILARAGGGADHQRAAAVIQKSLLPEVPKKSNVIRITFQHPDPAIVQPVLSAVIETYLKRHAEIHRAPGILDPSLARETEILASRLAETEARLRAALSNANIISLEDSKKGFSEQIAKVRQEIWDAEAELAQRQAAAAELSKLLNLKPAPATNETASAAPTLQRSNTPSLQFVGTNAPVGASNFQLSAFSPQLSPTNSQPSTNSQLSTFNSQLNSNSQLSTFNLQPSTNIRPAKLTEYKKLTSLLENLGKREQDLSIQFTPENAVLKSVQAQIAANEKVKQQLEDEYPGLLAVKSSELKPGPAGPGGPIVDLRAEFQNELSRVAGLQARIKVFASRLDQIRNEATLVNATEGSITVLQRTKELQEAQVKLFATTREQSRINEELAADHIANINTIQAPSPPFRDGKKLLKAQAVLLFAGIAGAFALAFLLELYLDRSLRRPIEIERSLGIPLFLSIPRMSLNGNGKARFLKAVPKVPLLAQTNSEHGTRNTEHTPSIQNPPIPSSPRHNEVPAGPRSTDGAVAPIIQNPTVVLRPSPTHSLTHSLTHSAALRPFYETLRDRLIAFFELKNLTHKPKLVAITSCGEGAGVTTAAAGLAASLSETGDGNVLLVDMNLHQGAAHHFYKGNLNCGLDDALEVGKRDTALVQDNLYVVTESTNGDQLPRVLPKRFKHLVPKLRASDYDYIIFDMPPVSQISATPRLARFMDMVFLVVESEKTDRDVVRRASNLLAESKCNLGVILNKNRTYVPKLLQQEL